MTVTFRRVIAQGAVFRFMRPLMWPDPTTRLVYASIVFVPRVLFAVPAQQERVVRIEVKAAFAELAAEGDVPWDAMQTDHRVDWVTIDPETGEDGPVWSRDPETPEELALAAAIDVAAREEMERRRDA